MRALLISLFHPEIVRGGAQQVAYELFDGLKRAPGVEPYLLAAIDPGHAAYYKSGACITGFDGRPGEFLFLSRNYDYWWHKTSDPRLLEAYAAFLRDLRPDVVHFHHFLLLGLDLLTYTRQIMPQVRIVFTLHEFLAICHADGQMLRRHDQSLCEQASPARCSQCFPAISPKSFFLRTLWVRRHFAVVDQFTTPSRFMIEPYVNWGLPREKITRVTNGQRDYSAGDTARPGNGNRLGFFGQMVDNKGVWLLLAAVALLRAEGFDDFCVEINGDNLKYAGATRRAEIEAFRDSEKALPIEQRRVVFNGPYEVGQLASRMNRIDWCVVPSVWWETFGLVISEAWMFGKPVIASDIGAMRERIRDGEDGLLFAAGDACALAAAIKRAVTEPGLRDSLVKQIVPPPSQAAMVTAMLEVYGLAPAAAALSKPVPIRKAIRKLNGHGVSAPS